MAARSTPGRTSSQRPRKSQCRGRTLIAESLRVGTDLENLELTVRKRARYQAQGTTPDQPGTWTQLDFEADEAVAGKLAQEFASALLQHLSGPGLPVPRGNETGRAGPRPRPTGGSFPPPRPSWTGRCDANPSGANRWPSTPAPGPPGVPVCPARRSPGSAVTRCLPTGGKLELRDPGDLLAGLRTLRGVAWSAPDPG